MTDEQKETLDNLVKNIVSELSHDNTLTDNELLLISEEIHYVFSRSLGLLINVTNYNKLAIISGVLESIKQELHYRLQNG